jgi:hypothetical protein
VAKVKASKLDADYDSELEPERGRQIIDTEPSATVATTKLQPGEPDEPEEGECLCKIPDLINMQNINKMLGMVE